MLAWSKKLQNRTIKRSVLLFLNEMIQSVMDVARVRHRCSRSAAYRNVYRSFEKSFAIYFSLFLEHTTVSSKPLSLVFHPTLFDSITLYVAVNRSNAVQEALVSA